LLRVSRARALGPILSLPLLLAACDAPRQGVDLLGSPALLQEAKVAGRDKAWVLGQAGKLVRIDDVGYRTLPASPESRIVYKLDIPKRARLSLAYAVAPEFHERPAVEFSVKVMRDGRQDTAFQSLVDPLGKPAHRLWLTAEVDLERFAGKGAELALETRSFDSTGDELRRAYWGAPAVTVPGQRAPLAIVYLVDTLRADHTSPYGYARDTTPELSRFAKQAVVFETAVAQAPWTKPSVASILTSKLPGDHRAVQLRDPLDLGQVTIAEMLQAKGYATGAAIANSVIYAAGANFEQGFDAFIGLHDAEGRASKEVPAGPVVDAALKFLDSRRGVPTFLYVHTMDPHVPYAPPPPFDRKWEPHPAPDHPGVDPRTDYKEPLDRERLIAQYDGDIAYGDQEFGRFVRELKARGRYDSALFVFMADHGEEFQDHGHWLHGRSVFDELIRIPLVVKFPGGRDAGKRIQQQVQSVDVLPTVLEELGLPVLTPPAIAGRPLRAVVAGGAPEPPAVSEVSSRGFVAHGMRTSKDKYIQRFSPEEGELYFDLVKDPRETHNVIDANRERARLLRAGVEAAMVHDPFRRHIRFTGAGSYEVRLRTPGWLEGVEPVGFGAGETNEVLDSGRKLLLRVQPRPGAPREVMLSVRPLAAPVWLEGTRDGRPLRPEDIAIAEPGFHPKQVPFKLPEIEPDDENAKFENVLVPPRREHLGIQLWLTLLRDRKVLEFGKDDCERMRALGYITGPC
jgi:arylsulfatase A-like enzyme